MSQQPILADTLNFVEKSGAALHASRELAEAIVTEREKVAMLLPVDADAMAAIKFLDGTPMIEAGEKQAAISKLGTHQGALEVLNNVLDLFADQVKTAHQTIKMLQQGKPSAAPGHAKTAAQVNSPDSPYIGARHGDGDQPESWRKMAAALGVS